MRLAASSSARRPVTVIGGFLGAGKTTLLNGLLANARGRYAVLINDFGAVNVDAGLISEHDGETLRLTNGCICCSLADGFVTTLLRVLDGNIPFDHIIIEASGVGDPRAIADIALVEPDLVLHAIIVLADAERLPGLSVDQRVGDTVIGQIKSADLVVLNKCDLVDEAGLVAALAALKGIRGDIPIVQAVQASLPDAILNLDVPRAASSAFHAVAERADHDGLFRPVLYRRRSAFDEDRFRDVLDDVPASLLRLKGAVHLGAKQTAGLLQLVGRRWSVTPSVAPGDWPIELVGVALDGPDVAAELATRLDSALLVTEWPEDKGEGRWLG